MELPRLGKSIRKVVLLQTDHAGKVVPTVIYKSRTKSKKVTRTFRPLEKGLRRVARAQVAFANTYLDKHNRSNQKRKDGWLTDFVSNIAQAGKNGTKKLRLGDIDAYN
jgi:hypothetical protein